MTDIPPLGTGAHLAFMAPLSAERADLLLRILALQPDARGIGVETHGPDIARARDNASARSLSDRVEFIEGAAVENLSAADVVINIGAFQAFGNVRDALGALRTLVKPGGRLLFGAEYWEHPPTAVQLANMWPGIAAEDNTDLAGLVDHAITAGFRPLKIETSTRSDWEEFESGLAADTEQWLLCNEDRREVDAVRSKLDTQRNIWLTGHRDVLGFAYLILGVPDPPG